MYIHLRPPPDHPVWFIGFNIFREDKVCAQQKDIEQERKSRVIPSTTIQWERLQRRKPKSEGKKEIIERWKNEKPTAREKKVGKRQKVNGLFFFFFLSSFFDFGFSPQKNIVTHTQNHFTWFINTALRTHTHAHTITPTYTNTLFWHKANVQ